MSRFSVSDAALAGLKKVVRERVGDNRGFFSRVFCAEDLAPAGWPGPIAQINLSFNTARGTVRGLHFQHSPRAEDKLVCCLRGAVWDVAVDLRLGSPTFRQWHAEILSAEGGEALLIPQGFAHGFQTLTADAELLYCHSIAYAPDLEGGLQPFDPAIGIDWPLTITELSARDERRPFVAKDFKGFVF
ncbi:MAG: dTDP-4-dehydrorhamnose 3,5-epimerase family protein [Sphingomonas sp.]